ncbi:ThiF family adenylyltransferase [Corynebacterium sp. HMSC29G08]|uniref:ThiF family adenylyltransferase n=1 Tax=Corynebacterium sp. HMSC29G08 TaxID=1581069 RepID=UPI0008A152F5|nr:ThiF family adenylyltransferase [Corynebacterium sp. HMSC29G08]OFT82692.1 molybdopterin biosynthesis protein MoeB [Corynebacterium sp. HMSC29G08]
MSERYLRQTTLIGDETQEKLRASHVAVIGAGGLGSPALLYLAAAGIGHITLFDDDVVDLSNLHRQVIHTTARVGEPKVHSAIAQLYALNPDTQITPVTQRLTWDTALDQLAGADVVLDGSDNFATRHVVSHACARLGIAHVWGSILGFEAQLSVFWAGRGPVYEDLFPAPPPPGSVPSCAQAGVLGPLVGVVGSAMAAEALKIVTGLGDPLVGQLGYFDMLTGTWEYIALVSNPNVAEQVRTGTPPTGPAEVEIIAEGATIIDVREPEEFTAFHLPGAINVPLGRILDGENPNKLENGGVIVCASGVRSAQAVAALQARGLTGLASLRGGLERITSG